MTESGASPRRRRLWRSLLTAVLAGLLLVSLLAWFTTTNSFQAMVRQRLVTEVEKITGGRVELGGFHSIPFRFQVDVRDLTIHGREAIGDVPYVHVDRLTARVKLISVLGAEFGFSSVVLERPVVHVIIYPDGTTNQPGPKLPRNGKDPVEQLFSLSIGRLEVREGEFFWNDQRFPLDFVAHDISAGMTYSLLHRRFDGDLLLGKLDTKIQDYRPFAWMAEMHFSLGHDNIEIHSLKARSGRSEIELSGRLESFHDPRVSGTYSVKADLEEVSAIARRAEVRRGTLQADGKGSWSLRDFSTNGKLSVRELDWRNALVAFRGASMDSQYSATRQQLSLSQIQAKLLGGTVAGDADASNWLEALAASPKDSKRKNAIQQKGSIRLKLRNLSLAEIAAAMASPSRPFDRLNLAGAASGASEIRWKGSTRNAEAEALVDIVPPARASHGQLPVTAHVHGTYLSSSDELRLDELSASTPATQVHASGTLSSSASLKLNVKTNNVAEWQPVLSAVGYHAPIPIAVGGMLSFSGYATGKLNDIAFAGHLQSQDLEFVIPAKSDRPERIIHWDTLTSDIQFSPHLVALHNGILHHGTAKVDFALTAGLQRRQLTDTSPITLTIDMHNADASEILALAGYDSSLTGTLDLSLQAEGTKAAPQGEGHVRVNNAAFRGQNIQRFDSKFSFNGQKVTLSDMRLEHDRSLVLGEANYDFSTHAVGFKLQGSNFLLSNFSQLQNSKVKLDGELGFTAQGSGTLEAPVVNTTILVHGLSFGGEPAGDFRLEAITQGADMQVKGTSQFTNAQLSIDGQIHLREDWPANLNLQFAHLDIDPWLKAYVQGPLTGHSSAAGEIHMTGPLRRPSDIEAIGNLSDLYADLEHIQVRNSGPIRFAVSRQVLKLDQFRLVGGGTDLSANGTMELTGDRQVNIHAAGRADLQLVQNINPRFTSSGSVTLDLTVLGSMSRPLMEGRLQISNGALAYGELPSALSDINGSLQFSQDRLQVEALTAHVGGGLVTFGGYATSYNRQLTFDLSLRTQDMRLRYPPGVSSITSADLRLVGTSSASQLSGEITVNKLAMTPGFDFASYLERSAQSSTLPQTDPLLNRIRLDVHVVTAPELQMQTAIVRLSGDADLRLRGTAAKPVLLGRADVIEGQIYFSGTRYRLERGDVTFTNPVTTTPVLDLQASTQVRDYDITINLNGQLDKLNMSYHSEPPLPTADIIGLLALGHTQEESAQLQSSGQSPFSQQASSAILSEALNATISNRAQRLFGISHIKIDPQGLNTVTTPTTTAPAVTIEQQVKDNLTLTYATNVSQTSQQIIQVEYNVTHNVAIVAIRDYNGVVSFDVRIRKRKR